jgi:hypothetical protein
MTARVVAVKPGTMAPEVCRGDTCFRVAKALPRSSSNWCKPKQADALIATGRSWHNPILVKAAK